MNAVTQLVPAAAASKLAEQRRHTYHWPGALSNELRSPSAAPSTKRLVTPGMSSLTRIAALYPHEEHFRSHIHMARHGFGKGEYRYFRYPLPELLGSLRTALYPGWRWSPTNGTSA